MFLGKFNECLNGAVCASKATCHDLVKGYTCICNYGYEGDGYKSCVSEGFSK